MYYCFANVGVTYNYIMDKETLDKGIAAYEKHKHLGLAAAEIGVHLQTLYWNLKKAGVAVTGDKSRYGTDKDRLAARAEAAFLKLVPIAEDRNSMEFQSKCDFSVFGHLVDVKASRLNSANGKYKSKRWAFSLKKQEATAEFFVCFALNEDGESVCKILLIPGDVARFMHTINLPEKGGKWAQYLATPEYITEFFCTVMRDE